MILQSRLRSGAAELGLELAEVQLNQLLSYLELIGKWNKVYNLTSIRNPEEMLTHHLMDCLSVVAPLLRKTGGSAIKLLDVGSGGGLPGAVLAIACPHIQVDCVDTVAKKAAFIQQVAAQLRLGNLRGLHARVETIADHYDVVSSRAFASLVDFVSLTAAAVAPGGKWLAMKGKRPDDEMTALPPTARVFHVEQLQVPGLTADRCIVWMEKSQPGDAGG